MSSVISLFITNHISCLVYMNKVYVSVSVYASCFRTIGIFIKYKFSLHCKLFHNHSFKVHFNINILAHNFGKPFQHPDSFKIASRSKVSAS